MTHPNRMFTRACKNQTLQSHKDCTMGFLRNLTSSIFVVAMQKKIAQNSRKVVAVSKKGDCGAN